MFGDDDGSRLSLDLEALVRAAVGEILADHGARRVAFSDAALGAVVRGGTPHFEYVAGSCADGLARVALDHDIPVIFGVLTTDDVEQALERAGTGEGNKGFDAAMTALEMIDTLRALRQRVAGPGDRAGEA